MLIRRPSQGFSLIELMIAVSVLIALMAVGLPAMFQFMQSAQIRTTSESLVAGLQSAKTEALRRNTQVRFSLVDDITGSCALASNGASWVISMEALDGVCNANPSDTVSPRILQTRSGKEGTPNARVVASGGAGDNNVLVFNGLGRLVTSNLNGFTQLDVTNPNGGACEHAASDGAMRCLRIRIAPGGDVRMCDPKISDATDPRSCG